jgi:hypothetical protein
MSRGGGIILVLVGFGIKAGSSPSYKLGFRW